MNLITGDELNAWRTKHDLTQSEVGDMLGEVTGPTVGRWENGQDIPGPVQKLLAWLIKGIEPFDREGAPQHVRQAMWRVEMSLGAWERLEALRTLAGYTSLTDWIAAMLREELAAPTMQPLPAAEMLRAAETEESPPVTEERREVKYERAKRGGRKP